VQRVLTNIRFTKLSILKMLVFLALVCILSLYINSSQSDAASYDYINFQGKLTASNGIAVPTSGNPYSVQFGIYDNPVAGTQRWTETQNVTVDDRGIFSVSLGSVTPFGTLFGDYSDLYLAINIGGDGWMTPRHPISSVPNAMRLQGKSPGTGANNLLALDGSGNVDIAGNIQGSTLISDVATGTAPLTVSSTTKVTNLNVDQADGYSFNQDVQTTSSPTFNTPTVAGITIGANTLNTSEWANLDGQDQTIKTTSSPTFANLTDSAMTLGSVLFAGTGGVLSQDNTNLFWDNTNKKLGIGLATPLSPVDVMRGTITTYPQYLNIATTDAFRSFYYNSTTSSTPRAGLFVTVDTATADNTNSNMGLNSFAYKDGSGNNTAAAGYVAGRYGVRTTASATGNISNATAIETGITPNAAWNGTIINAKGILGKAFTAGGGTITNAYNIYLEPQTVGSTVNVGIALAGDSSMSSAVNQGSAIIFGAGQDAGISYDGTDLIIDPNMVGSGKVKIGTTANDNLDAGQIAGSDGLVTKVNAGACDDTIFTVDTNGLMCIDSTNGRIYFRYGGAWHYVNQTAGFQIPNYEAAGINPGDFLIPYAESRMSDGAIHGLYAKFSDIKDELLGDITSRINQLSNLKVDNLTVTDLQVNNNLTVSGDATVKGDILVEGNSVFEGGMDFKRTAVSDDDYRVKDTDYLIAYTSLTGKRTITLPDSLKKSGKTFVIKDESFKARTNNIIIDPEGDTKIEQVGTYALVKNGSNVSIYSDGESWFVLR